MFRWIRGQSQTSEFVALAQYIQKCDEMMAEFVVCRLSGGHKASLVRQGIHDGGHRLTSCTEPPFPFAAMQTLRTASCSVSVCPEMKPFGPTKLKIHPVSSCSPVPM